MVCGSSLQKSYEIQQKPYTWFKRVQRKKTLIWGLIRSVFFTFKYPS